MQTTDDLSSSQTERDKHFPPVNETRWRLFGIGVVIVWLLVWELTIQYVLGQLYFVPPSVMLRSFYRSLLVTGELGPHIWATVVRLLIGLVVGAVPAVWLGLRIGRSERARLHYGPFLQVPDSKHDNEKWEAGNHWNETECGKKKTIVDPSPLISTHVQAKPHRRHSSDQ